MLVGALAFIAGALLTFKISIPFIGRLPGDFVFSGSNYTIYLPIATSILLSIILSLLIYLFNK